MKTKKTCYACGARAHKMKLFLVDGKRVFLCKECKKEYLTEEK